MVAGIDYSSVVEKLDEVEEDIEGYQEFLGDLRLTYEKCGEGCSESRGSGRSIEPDYLMQLCQEFGFSDEFIEEELERAQSVQARRLRRLTKHCRALLAEKRKRRRNLRQARNRLERETAFARHPKKDESRNSG